ncbi:Arc family DNA-binding protein [Psychrobacter pocilloporae]|uniref:Arc family DNA-binding protein n=1 Tax=Psychrobacter pocilloporae TaxID=1775882 RepID=UPI003C2C5412
MTIQSDPQYKLRLPERLRDKIKESASTHNRSMNADIVARLEDSFAGVTNVNEFNEKLQEMAGELIALSTENREMRRLYIEALNSNFDKIPEGLKSKYGILLSELIEDEKKPGI